MIAKRPYIKLQGIFYFVIRLIEMRGCDWFKSRHVVYDNMQYCLATRC